MTGLGLLSLVRPARLTAMRVGRPPVLLVLAAFAGLLVASPTSSAAGNLPDHCYSNSDDPQAFKDVECDAVKLPALGGVVSVLLPGTMLPRKLPKCRYADVFWPDYSAYNREPKDGLSVHYRTGVSQVTAVAWPNTSVRHVGTALTRDLRHHVFRLAGDRLTVGAFTAGRFHGRLITALTEKPPNRSFYTYEKRYYIWKSGGLTYLLIAEEVHGHRLAVRPRTIVASFAAVS